MTGEDKGGRETEAAHQAMCLSVHRQMERWTAAQAGEQKPPEPWPPPFLLVETDSLLSLEPGLTNTPQPHHTPEQQEARLGEYPHNPEPCLPVFSVLDRKGQRIEGVGTSSYQWPLGCCSPPDGMFARPVLRDGEGGALDCSPWWMALALCLYLLGGKLWSPGALCHWCHSPQRSTCSVRGITAEPVLCPHSRGQGYLKT